MNSKTERYELESMARASLNVQFSWAMKALAEALKTTKKSLRETWRIINRADFEDEIMIGGKMKRARFFYGFRNFTIIRNKKRREIRAPHPKAQKTLRAVGKTLTELEPAHPRAFGFVKKRNIKKAARTLLGNKHYFSFDIAEAFPSITAEMVKQSLERLNISPSLIEPLAWLTTCHYDQKRRLPQGASSSPALLNLVYKPMCREIDKVCKKHGLKWFVYADDFNFASPEKIPDEIKEELLSVPASFGFSVKREKIKDNLGKTIPHILGLTIVNEDNQKIHLRRRAKKKFRRISYMAQRYGIYPEEKVRGLAAAVGQIYGPEKNWPGWVKRFWIEHRKKGGRNEKQE